MPIPRRPTPGRSTVPTPPPCASLKTYPDDGDVGALTGQALMLLHRKGSWTHEGEPQPGTDEVIQTLKTVIAKHPQHPYALHLLVHVVEASPHPEWETRRPTSCETWLPGSAI